MGIEWIPIDQNIGEKAETLELMERTACSVEVCVYRLFRLWSWFSLESHDGTAKATPERLTVACGGDPDFWLAVEAVGWLEFDREARTATVPGWELRFSSSAKARACDRNRKFSERKRGFQKSPDKCPEKSGQMSGQVRTNVRSDPEHRIEQNPPPPRIAAQAEPEPEAATADGWRQLREAWNAGAGQRWRSPRPPAEAVERLSESGWLDAALAALPKLAAARFFTERVHLPQFCGAGFVDRLASDQYAQPKKRDRRGYAAAVDEKPPPREWGDELKARQRVTEELLRRKAEAAG